MNREEFDPQLLVEPDVDEPEIPLRRLKGRRRKLSKKELRTIFSYIG
ncbi:MAG: hypothetical protein QXS37_04135 [Candidatus Aenigmatarchaeota archaeon]